MAVDELGFADVLAENARRWPSVTAIIDEDSGLRLTYPQLAQRVAQLAGALQAHGVGPGERIAWLGQNSFRVLELVLAAAQIGAALCIANWRQSKEEFEFLLDDIGPRLVVWQEQDIGGVIDAVRQARPSKEAWLQHDRADGYEAALAAAVPVAPAAVDASAPLVLLYTAAFSGKPAAAILTHRGMLLQSLAYANARRIDETQRYLNATPLFHVGTLLDTFTTFLVGGTNLFMRQADAAGMCAIIARESVTGAFLMGPTIEQMVAANADGRFDLKSLRALGYNEAWNRMVTVDDTGWGRRPYGYGQTETMGYATFSALGPAGAGGTGRPSAMTSIAILDEAGNEVPAGETGEIAVKGFTVSPGYWNRPDLNAARYQKGWRRTNDLGRRETDGTLSFVGPKGRLIKSAGENIYPAEVEGCIRRLAGVADVGVIGVPDPLWVQSVRAVVVVKPGQELTEEAVIAHCRAQIASYKKPRSVVFVDSLPRAGGAVDYAALDAQHGGGGYPRA